MLVYRIVYRFRNDLNVPQECLIVADHIDHVISQFRTEYADEFELPEIDLIKCLGVAIIAENDI